MRASSHEPDLNALGARIREVRHRRGLSQEELAFRAKLDRSYVGGVERGERNLSFVNLCRLTRALGVSLEEIFKQFGDHNGKRNNKGR